MRSSLRLPSLRRSVALPFRHLSLWLLSFCFAASAAKAQQQFQGYCARVKIEIVQELTLERVGFEATLEVTNNDAAEPITDFFAALTFDDPKPEGGGAVQDAVDRFFVRAPQLTAINNIAGSGVIGPGQTAVVRWFIIPKIAAGGTDPRGHVYQVGARLGGKLAGLEIPAENMFVIADTITVRPEPQLEITYFQPRDVQGDDPFTTEVETPVPFTLGVLVKNTGFGSAKRLQIDSQQPKIVENKQGLLLVAQLLGARVQDSPLARANLVVDLGDIGPGQTRKGAWDMVTSLSGEFVEFKASYTHDSDLGGLETSVITKLTAHFIAHEMLVDLPGRDTVRDFLAITDRDQTDLIPDRIFESQGNELPVNHLTQTSLVSALGANRKFTLRVVSDFAGWGFARLPDPGQARYAIKRVVRSDGKVLSPHNTWTNVRYDRVTNARRTWLNLIDDVEAGATYDYEVEYQRVLDDHTPPVTTLLFAGPAQTVGGTTYVTADTQLYFMADDVSPVNIQYRLNGGALTPGLPFQLTTPGTYVVTFHATDFEDNVETPRSVTVISGGFAPAIGALAVPTGAFLPTGGAVSVRPGAAEITFNVPASPIMVDAQIDIFAGVRGWPTIAGTPASPTPATNATLTVAGDHVDFYRYRIGAGAWSAERAIAQPIALTSLPVGDITVAVLGRSQHGAYPAESAATTVTWKVQAGAPAWNITGAPASPARTADATLTPSRSGITQFRWALDDSFLRPAAPLAPVVLSALPPGAHAVTFLGNPSNTWETPEQAAAVRWLVDPSYGSNYDAFTLIRTYQLPGVQGTSPRFTWDGRNAAGALAPSGWYTVRIRLTDALGKTVFATRLVHLDNLAGGASTLADATRAGRRPHGRGEWLVWQERPTGTWEIAARKLTDTAAPILRVTPSATSAQEAPRTDGRYVAWQARQPDGNWDIVVRDLTAPAAAPRVVTATPAFDETRPTIDWPWVVYQRRPLADAAAPQQLFAQNLVTGESFAVDASTQNQLDPDLQGGRVVWQDWRDVGAGEIYLADLETLEVRRLTAHAAGQQRPVLHGDWVVWEDNRDNQLDLYGFDLRRAASIRLTNSPENETQPSLSGPWLVFADDAASAQLGNLRLLHLDSGRFVPLTNTPTGKSLPVLTGGHLAWQESVGASTEVRLAPLPALQGVFRNHNTVVITPALAARYATAHALLAAWSAEAGVTAVSRFPTLVPAVTQETATWSGGAASGPNFALSAGSFLWIEFGAGEVLDLGSAVTTARDLSAGLNALALSHLPPGTSAHALLKKLGLVNVRALRVLDAGAGRWRTVEVQSGAFVGADFVLPEVGVVFLDLLNPVSAWTP